MLRGTFIIWGCVVDIVGYVVLLASKRPAVQYGGTFLMASGVYPGSPCVMGWLSNNLAPHNMRATGVGFQIAIANLCCICGHFHVPVKGCVSHPPSFHPITY